MGLWSVTPAHSQLGSNGDSRKAPTGKADKQLYRVVEGQNVLLNRRTSPGQVARICCGQTKGRVRHSDLGPGLWPGGGVM